MKTVSGYFTRSPCLLDIVRKECKDTGKSTVLSPPSLLQVTCLSSGCTLGNYSSTSTAAIGDLRSGSDICVPCDPLCEACTGRGTRILECVCRYAAHLDEGCLRSCNASTGEVD